MSDPVNEVGNVYGKWTVLRLDENRDIRGQLVFLCECKCGRNRLIAGAHLRAKKTTGCFKCNRRRPRTPKPTLQELLSNHTEVNGCWEWNGRLEPNGYACVSFKEDKKVSPIHLVSRLIFSYLLNRDLLRTEHICHKCDNPKCINPDHLFLGNGSINAKDMHKKGRNAYGVRIGGAVLDDEKVAFIRGSTLSIRKLAVQVKASKEAVRTARRGIYWKHVPFLEKKVDA